jgi:hypothetical protein
MSSAMSPRFASRKRKRARAYWSSSANQWTLLGFSPTSVPALSVVAL